jgi:hypothetical protein
MLIDGAIVTAHATGKPDAAESAQEAAAHLLKFATS